MGLAYAIRQGFSRLLVSDLKLFCLRRGVFGTRNAPLAVLYGLLDAVSKPGRLIEVEGEVQPTEGDLETGSESASFGLRVPAATHAPAPNPTSCPIPSDAQPTDAETAPPDFRFLQTARWVLTHIRGTQN